MKIKAIVTINTGLYMDIRPEITIDTEDYESAKKLIRELHMHFFGMLQPDNLRKGLDFKKAADVGMDDAENDI